MTLQCLDRGAVVAGRILLVCASFVLSLSAVADAAGKPYPKHWTAGQDIRRYTIEPFSSNGEEGYHGSGFTISYESRFNPPSPYNKGWSQHELAVTCKGPKNEVGIRTVVYVEKEGNLIELINEETLVDDMRQRDGSRDGHYKTWAHYCR